VRRSGHQREAPSTWLRARRPGSQGPSARGSVPGAKVPSASRRRSSRWLDGRHAAHLEGRFRPGLDGDRGRWRARCRRRAAGGVCACFVLPILRLCCLSSTLCSERDEDAPVRKAGYPAVETPPMR